ncbi:MAG: hypothetical protein AAGI70_01475 [Pseudomonadota bacterium]
MLRPLLIALLPVTAHAACPTPADLEGAGIWVRSDDGAITHYVRTSPDMVAETTMYDANEGYWLESYRGLYVTADQDIQNGGRVEGTLTRSTYPGGVASLPQPEPGARWSGPVTDTNADGTDVQKFSVAFGEVQEVKIGPCTYQGIPADTVFHEEGGGGTTGRLVYLPDLSISLFIASGSVGAFYSDYYQITEISNAPLP